jgi:hypothetical protein
MVLMLLLLLLLLLLLRVSVIPFSIVINWKTPTAGSRGGKAQRAELRQ